MNRWNIEFKYYSKLSAWLKRGTVIVNRFSVVAATVLLLTFIFDVGFLSEAEPRQYLHLFYGLSLGFFFAYYLVSFIRTLYERTDKHYIIWSDFARLALVFLVFEGGFLNVEYFESFSFLRIFTHRYILNLTFLIIFLSESGRYSLRLLSRRMNPALLFIGSFTALIIIGTGLLMLPNSTTAGISFIDSLFTSTSAVCVTGLVVVDTATAFTPLGQTIILVLIQLGGLGVMTFTTFFGLFFRMGNSFQSQLLLKEVLNLDRIGGIFKVLLKILLVTLVFEFLGAVLIFHSIARIAALGGLQDKMAFSVFHSISAFCNAGFSTLSNGLYTEAIRYDHSLQVWIMVLIVLGGLGFPIIFNYFTLIRHFIGNKVRQLLGRQVRYIHRPRIINLNARIVMFTTAALIAFGAILFFIFEHNNTLAGESWFGKISGSFFGSITPRTAGFNTVDVGKLLTPTLLLTIFLMWIGASPGSTGGGIKTTTFAVALLNIVNLATGKKHFMVGRREISNTSVQRAFAVVFLSVLVISFGTFLILIFQPNLNPLSVLFEATSAFSTVGLSVGITAQLAIPSKFVIILLMLIGRVGLLTIVFSLVGQQKSAVGFRLPAENIYIN